MEEARAVNMIETNLSQEKIDFINTAYAEEVNYWKRAALGSKNGEERKKLTNLAPSRVFWLIKMLERVTPKISTKCFFILKRIIQLIMKSKLVLMTFHKMIIFHSKKCPGT